MGKVGVGLAVGCAIVSCTLAAILVSRQVKERGKWKRALSVLREFEEECSTPIGRLRQVVDALCVEMHAGLASEGGSKLKMLLTFVDRLPDGGQTGTYYGLDFGGSHFRILKIQLGGRQQRIIHQQVERLSIPPYILTGTSQELYDFIASALKGFVEASESRLNSCTSEIGFTFSFPMKHTSVSSGLLVKWTKGFAIEDMYGRDIAECLHQAMDRVGLDMRVAALINDTVGTLAVGHYYDDDVIAAVIIGTGTNACYIERADAITKCQGLLANSGCMVVNIEWGNFWSSHLPRTSYDKSLDDESTNPSEQGFEKMISGMYLGEILRRVLLRMARESDLFHDIGSKLHEPFSLRTPLMSEMHLDDSPDLREVARLMRENLGVLDIPMKVRALIVRVCDIVTCRAARLVAAGIAAVVKKTDGGSGTGVDGRSKGNGHGSKLKRIVIAIEGGLYESYPKFREHLHAAVEELLGEDRVILRLTSDGPGIGAALIAAANSGSNVGSQ